MAPLARGLSDHACKAASVDCYPSLPTAFLTRRGIDFSAGLYWLLDWSESSAIAFRTFDLRRVRGWVFRRRLFHCDLSKKTVGQNMIGRRFSDWVREMSGVFNLAGLCAFATKVAH